DIEKLVDTSDEWITTRTGIRKRHVVQGDETAASLASNAALDALGFADLDPAEIDLIIVATSTPDNLYPSTACLVQAHVGAVKAAAFDVEAACTGIVYALTIAQQFIATGMYKTVLICGVDIHSRFLNWEDRNTCILFGDGAGAFILQACEENELLATHLKADGGGAHLLHIPNYGTMYPHKGIERPQAMHRFLQMNGRAIYEFAVKEVPEIVRLCCKKAGIEVKDLDFFVPHQANHRIIKAAAERLGLSGNQIVSNVADYGNTSAASIPLAFTDAVRRGHVKAPATMALVGFGGGLTWGATILKWTALDKRRAGQESADLASTDNLTGIGS
ncbi:MAG: ketoacyl-ACP synthase III, partial [Candidatus Obscuribacterales bacterium]|nr:ketoacyl-ACP synthase III [Candidatus Obscuribacterales bacterium]